MELTLEQKTEIADMVLKMVMDRISMVQKVHMELFVAMKNLFDKYPQLKGRHKELGAIITKLEQANPNLKIEELLETAAQEMIRCQPTLAEPLLTS